MSEPIGQVVLRQVADHLRANPAAWCKGGGTLSSVMHAGPTAIKHAMQLQDATGCKHTFIVCFATLTVGIRGRDEAVKQAVTILCTHHGLNDAPGSVMDYNDDLCGNAENAVKFIDSALNAPPASPAQTSKAVKSLVTAALALAIFVQSLGHLA